VLSLVNRILVLKQQSEEKQKPKDKVGAPSDYSIDSSGQALRICYHVISVVFGTTPDFRAAAAPHNGRNTTTLGSVVRHCFFRTGGVRRYDNVHTTNGANA
jgi:hypothetical protein